MLYTFDTICSTSASYYVAVIINGTCTCTCTYVHKFLFYPRQIPVNYTIYFKKAILSKVKNRFNQDYYSKTYNQNDFLLYFIFQKI